MLGLKEFPEVHRKRLMRLDLNVGMKNSVWIISLERKHQLDLKTGLRRYLSLQRQTLGNGNEYRFMIKARFLNS